MLTATNKKWWMMRLGPRGILRRRRKVGKSKTAPCHGNYCWMHGHHISVGHTSATCAMKAQGHRDNATAANTMGGSETHKGWDTART